MTRVLREHLALVFTATFLGLFFVFGLGGGEWVMLTRFMMIVWLVLMVLAWKPLHKRFRAWAILFSYFQVGVPLILLSDPSVSLSDFQGALLLALVFSVVVLLFNRQKPIEQRDPSLAFMIIHGLWELLEKKGVSTDEIERMKRLTQEERAALWAALSRGRGGDSSAQRLARAKELDEWMDELRIDPAYSFSLGNVHHEFDDRW